MNDAEFIKTILSFFAYVAGFAAIPLLIKTSTGLAGRLLGMVNDRSKGVFDKYKNYSRGKAEEIRKTRKGGKKLWRAKKGITPKTRPQGQESLRQRWARWRENRDILANRAAKKFARWEMGGSLFGERDFDSSLEQMRIDGKEGTRAYRRIERRSELQAIINSRISSADREQSSTIFKGHLETLKDIDVGQIKVVANTAQEPLRQAAAAIALLQRGEDKASIKIIQNLKGQAALAALDSGVLKAAFEDRRPEWQFAKQSKINNTWQIVPNVDILKNITSTNACKMSLDSWETLQRADPAHFLTVAKNSVMQDVPRANTRPDVLKFAEKALLAGNLISSSEWKTLAENKNPATFNHLKQVAQKNPNKYSQALKLILGAEAAAKNKATKNKKNNP